MEINEGICHRFDNPFIPEVVVIGGSSIRKDERIYLETRSTAPEIVVIERYAEAVTTIKNLALHYPIP